MNIKKHRPKKNIQSNFSKKEQKYYINRLFINKLKMATTACTRFSDNYEIKEELGK